MPPCAMSLASVATALRLRCVHVESLSSFEQPTQRGVGCVIHTNGNLCTGSLITNYNVSSMHRSLVACKVIVSLPFVNVSSDA